MTPAEPGLFSKRAPVLLAAIGILAFGTWLVLSAFGAETRTGHDGGAHALSISGTGFAGLVKLVQATGRVAYAARSKADVGQAALAVLTPDLDTKTEDIVALVRSRPNRPTLIVLPKWETAPLDAHRGWVEQNGTNSIAALQRLLNGVTGNPAITIADRNAGSQALTYSSGGLGFRPPQTVRALAGEGLAAIVANGEGQAVLARIGKIVFVLADRISSPIMLLPSRPTPEPRSNS